MFTSRAAWKHPRVLIVLALVFLAGSAAGAAVMQAIIHRHIAASPRFEEVITEDRLKTELNLTPEQSQKLRSILGDMLRYNEDLYEQINSYRATGKSRIAAILDDGQKQKFKKICDGVK